METASHIVTNQVKSATSSTKEYDAIVIGLGCFGLGAAYYLQKQGLSVLSFDKATESGAIGSGTVGYGRIWRYLHNEVRYAKMQEEAVEVFKELEKKTGNEMLVGGGLLYMKPKGHPDLLEFQKYGELLDANTINKRWPAFRIPDYIQGVFALDAGVVNVRNALYGCRDESKKLGADLRFGTMVVNVDHEAGTVTTLNGDIFKAKNIVVTCGALTD